LQPLQEVVWQQLHVALLHVLWMLLLLLLLLPAGAMTDAHWRAT
jgi:hypothetical protein